MQTILANGTIIKLTSIDYNGLAGRRAQFTPLEADIGAPGKILGNRVEIMDENLCLVDSVCGMLAGAQASDDDLVMYIVQLDSHRLLHLASYEVEIIR